MGRRVSRGDLVIARTWAEQQQIEQELVSTARKAWIGGLLADHHSFRGAAREAEMNVGTLVRMAKEFDLKPEQPKPEPKTERGRKRKAAIIARENLARELAAQGATLAQAAERLGITKSGAHVIEQRLGITFQRDQPAKRPPSNVKPKPRHGERPPPRTMADFAALENERMRANLRGAR